MFGMSTDEWFKTEDGQKFLAEAAKYRARMAERDRRIVDQSQLIGEDLRHRYHRYAEDANNMRDIDRDIDLRPEKEWLCALLEAAAEFAFRHGMSEHSLLFFMGQRTEAAYGRLSCICQHPSEGSMRICLVCSKQMSPARVGT